MKTRTLGAILACLAAMPLPALALDVGVSLGGNASTTSDGTSLDAGLNLGIQASATDGMEDTTQAGLSANASTAASLTLGVDAAELDELDQVVALIETSAWTENSLSGLTEIDGTVYDVAAWIDAENAAAFDAVLSANAEGIETLQAAVAANAAFDAWLEASGETAGAVIAVGVAADGSLAVFTNQ